jgi:hypothetical protein
MIGNVLRRCLALNIRIDRNKGLDGDLLRHYVRALAADPPPATLQDWIGTADRAWGGGIAANDALCRGTRSLGPTFLRLVRIIGLDALVENHIRGRINTHARARLRADLSTVKHKVRRKLCNRMRSRTRIHFWLSTADDTRDSLDLSHMTRADAANHLLGLLRPKGSDLLMLVFPPDYFREAWIPTIIDGGASEAFCAWPDERPGVGFTWRTDQQTGGVPEVVGKDADLDPRADIDDLGTTTQRQPRLNYLRMLRRCQDADGLPLP